MGARPVPLATAGRRWRRWSLAPAVLAMTWACTGSDAPNAAMGGPQKAIPPLPTSFHRGMNIEPIGGYGASIDLGALPVSLDAFGPPTGDRDEGIDGANCLELLDRIRNVVATVAARYDRRVLLTEVGYKFAFGAAYRPWEWYDDQVADVTVQTTAYTCLVELLGTVAGGQLARRRVLLDLAHRSRLGRTR